MKLKTIMRVSLEGVFYAETLVLSSFIALSPLSVQASNVLPTGLKSNMLIQIPKNTGNLSEGYELAKGSSVSVTLRLLAPVNHSSVDYGCVLASQTRNYEIVQGNLNARFGHNVADPSFVFAGSVNVAFGAATPLEKLQNVLSNSVGGSALSLTGLDCYNLSSLSSPPQTLNYTAQAHDQRLLMVDLSVTNQAGQPVPVKLTVTIGTSPYAQLAQRAQVADQVSGIILNSQLEATPFDVAKIPNLDAGKITSGLLPLTRGGTGAGDAVSALNNLLPSQAGQSGRVLSTDGANPSWIAVPGGLVTSVAGRTGDVVLGAGDVSGLATSATTDSTNASNISSGTLNIARIPVGTGAGTVAAGDDSRFSDARAPSGSAGGDLSGTFPNPSVARIQGQAVAVTTPQADQVLQLSAGSWQPRYFGLGSLRTSLGAVQVTSASCGANQTLTWSAITDQISCQNINIANTQVTGLGSLATQNSINLASDTTGALALANLAQSGASVNQVVRWNGTGWVPSSETIPSWAMVTGKPTTLSGYGIADAVSLTLPDAQVLVGNASNLATPVTLSGDAAISNAGVLTLSSTGVVADTYTKVTVSASGRVTAGNTLADTDIPSLDASKITTGTLDLARLPAASDSQGGIMATVAQSIAGMKTFLNDIMMQGSLTVTGSIEADRVKLANSASACDGANEGAMKYNATLKRLQYCNGISWVSVAKPCDFGAPGELGALLGDGTYYVGCIDGVHYATTPGNCQEVPSPNRAGTCPGANCYPTADFTATCTGATDTLNKTWNNGTLNWYDIPGISNYTTTFGTDNWDGNLDINSGSHNTAQMVAITDSTEGGYHAAAHYCDRMEFGGQSDWFLPNRRELDQLRRIGSSLQSTLGVSTSGSWYWSSSESSSNYAWYQRFNDGYQENWNAKGGFGTRVRCFRKLN